MIAGRSCVAAVAGGVSALLGLAAAPPPALALANPAAVFCVESGGKSEILVNAAGAQFGICILPDGQMVEEWAYYRTKHRPRNPPAER
jgi:putative hemolysin